MEAEFVFANIGVNITSDGGGHLGAPLGYDEYFSATLACQVNRWKAIEANKNGGYLSPPRIFALTKARPAGGPTSLGKSMTSACKCCLWKISSRKRCCLLSPLAVPMSRSHGSHRPPTTPGWIRHPVPAHQLRSSKPNISGGHQTDCTTYSRPR